MNKDELLKAIKKDLRENKNQWVYCEYIAEGKLIRYKRWNTYFQTFKVGDINVGLPMEKNQTEILSLISGALNRLEDERQRIKWTY